MEKPVDEQSPEAPSQDVLSMRFSDEVTVAEVARLLGLVQGRRGGITDWRGAQGDEFESNREWCR